MSDLYDQGLPKTAANHVALSPVSFVERSAEVFGDLPAVIHGQRRYTWRELRDRSARLAAALQALGIGRNDTVSVMLPNTPEMIEVHYAVPALNAVLNTLNTRLDAALLAWQMNHCEAKVLITDREFAPTIAPALRLLRDEHGRTPIVIDVADSEYLGAGERLGTHDYEALLAEQAQRLADRGRELAVGDDHAGFAVVHLPGQQRRVEARVERVQYRAKGRHRVVRLDHLGRVGEHHAHRVARTDA